MKSAYVYMCMLALLGAVSATGAYNYSLTLDVKDFSVPVGESAVMTGYVSYNSSPVKEYPCLFTSYDYKDSHPKDSVRFYTDELGQFTFKYLVSDAYLYGNNYSFTISCSNNSTTGSIYASSGNTPNWFFNNLLYAQNNGAFLTILVIFIIALLAGAGIVLYALR